MKIKEIARVSEDRNKPQDPPVRAKRGQLSKDVVKYINHNPGQNRHQIRYALTQYTGSQINLALYRLVNATRVKAIKQDGRNRYYAMNYITGADIAAKKAEAIVPTPPSAPEAEPKPEPATATPDCSIMIAGARALIRDYLYAQYTGTIKGDSDGETLKGFIQYIEELEQS